MLKPPAQSSTHFSKCGSYPMSSTAPSPAPPSELEQPSASNPPPEEEPNRASIARSGTSGSSWGAPPSDRLDLASQRELPDEEARLVYIGDPDRTNEGFGFAGNSIRTSKYTLLTFLPKNLFEQFHRVAYIYFLVIACINQVPQLKVFQPAISFLPLAMVLFFGAIKDGYEDWRRHQSDRAENNRLAPVLATDGEFHPRRLRDIRVGDVVKVFAGEPIPCDMVLLSTSDPSGVAYLNTINLDGESNLKTRYAKREVVEGLIRCEEANRNIYGFQANLAAAGDGHGGESSRRESLGPANVVLRGCELKNTGWVTGVAVYTGMETKIMLNNSGAPSKRSRMERHMNRDTILLAITLVFMCLVVSVSANFWLRRHRGELNHTPYYRKKDYSTGVEEDYEYYGIFLEWVFSFLQAMILFQRVIPLDLFIMVDFIRVVQARFMSNDRKMFDEGSGKGLQCRALNINEDLGMVRYVFSDKTGTLTQNKMVFQCASVCGVDFSSGGALEEEEKGVSVTVQKEVWKPKMTIKTDPDLLRLIRSGKGTEKGSLPHDFFLALSLCNTIVPIVLATPDLNVKLIEYQGESPDEQALVYAAASYGYVVLERTASHVAVDVLGHRQRFNVLGFHEFDSDRKRMSVIVGFPDNTVKLFVKGADSSMLSVLDKAMSSEIISATESHLHKYASLGLRTLVIGMKQLSSDDFKEWQFAYEKASTALFGRVGLLRKVAANVESNLQILGASGIEDKLQDGVPEAIESLRTAGMKVWVLTGDKQETAISIGYSCKLLTRDMTQIIINGNNKESCKRKLNDALAMSSEVISMSPGGQSISRGMGLRQVPLALIIDGTSLVYILENELEEELFKVAIACDVVLCCRVAPLQKAGIVALIKKRTDDMTLAIGDGANDVSMIQMADLGIGISGQEGRQAVMASDFAMGQFRSLVPLLLVHGHWNYQRMAYMILYNFYRNSIIVFILFWYVLNTAFTLTTAISEWSNVLYSVIYTAMPTIVVGVLDKDISRMTLLKYPQLYGAGQREEKYNLKMFLLTMTDSLWQSLAIFFIPYFAFRHSTIDVSSIGDIFTIAVVILVNIHLAMDVFRWNWITHASIWGCIVATVICVIIIDSLPNMPGYWAIFHIIRTGLFWFCLLGILVAGIAPHFFMKAVTEYFFPTDIQIAHELKKVESSDKVSTLEVEMNAATNPSQGITR